MGDVNAKAVGTTNISNIEKVKDRAYKKLKIQAAMLGANIIYLSDQRSQGNKWGGLYVGGGQKAETSLTGVGYSNKVLDLKKIINIIGDKRKFTVKTLYVLRNSSFDIEKTENLKMDLI